MQLPRPTDIQSSSPTTEFRVRTAPLGDGYERDAPIGLNNAYTEYTISWVPLDEDEAYAIVDALRTTNGTERIQWTPPERVTEANWTASNIRYPHVEVNQIQVSVTLREKFGS